MVDALTGKNLKEINSLVNVSHFFHNFTYSYIWQYIVINLKYLLYFQFHFNILLKYFSCLTKSSLFLHGLTFYNFIYFLKLKFDQIHRLQYFSLHANSSVKKYLFFYFYFLECTDIGNSRSRINVHIFPFTHFL